MMSSFKKIIELLAVLTLVSALAVEGRQRQRVKSQMGIAQCDNFADFEPIRKKIRTYQDDVNKIVDYVLSGLGSGKVWNDLALLCDTFGPRMSGSKSLEAAIDHMENKMRNESKLNVTAEEVKVPKWEVHDQWAEISEPSKHKLSILALGSSVATNGTLEREAVVIKQLDQLSESVRDKIVVFNYKYISYSKSVVFRTRGALEAAKYGAAAALVRSVTPLSVYSPHTGMSIKSIPTAAITVEDADRIERMVNRNHKVKIKLFLDTKQYDDARSRNLVGDITGTKRPEEIVLVSGHIDSWYNTDGAMDDGGGMMISYGALDVLSKLNLRGERTMRAVLWTAEEFGLVGAQQYFDRHKAELNNFKAVIESDEGTFWPRGFGYANMGRLGQCVMWEILAMGLKSANELIDRFEGSDIELFTKAGVPGLSLFNDNAEYFYYHHSAGDSMTVEDPTNLDHGTILFATTLYVLSNLDVDLRK